MTNLMDKTIFIVDDDPYWLKVLKKMLTDLGYTNIREFTNGASCIDNLHLSPGLIFMDYQMDEMNGLEALKKVKDYYTGIGVIFCTAHEDLKVAVNAIRNGSYDFLLKHHADKSKIAAIIESLNEHQQMDGKVF